VDPAPQVLLSNCYEWSRLRQAFLRRPAEPDYGGQDGATGSQLKSGAKGAKKDELQMYVDLRRWGTEREVKAEKSVAFLGSTGSIQFPTFGLASEPALHCEAKRLRAGGNAFILGGL
jgi:hypothetical protein